VFARLRFPAETHNVNWDLSASRQSAYGFERDETVVHRSGLEYLEHGQIVGHLEENGINSGLMRIGGKNEARKQPPLRVQKHSIEG